MPRYQITIALDQPADPEDVAKAVAKAVKKLLEKYGITDAEIKYKIERP